ncbi:hypothetical protein KIS1582_3911 [Cytobacillus firmus]|uniref:Uncharacterized protein n=1 Tax=Cytobacillus firmus TaxID=1399 RepID=A0A800N8W8_CYTFI|nr:hypothetical protein KIS1582_3911 [Cytobacillus firmus]
MVTTSNLNPISKTGEIINNLDKYLFLEWFELRQAFKWTVAN